MIMKKIKSWIERRKEKREVKKWLYNRLVGLKEIEKRSLNEARVEFNEKMKETGAMPEKTKRQQEAKSQARLDALWNLRDKEMRVTELFGRLILTSNELSEVFLKT